MFLRCKKRFKDGKEHFYWSIVENQRGSGGRIIQRHVLYLGELNGRQEASWQTTIELFERNGDTAPQQVPSFPRNTCLLMPDFARFPPLASGFRKCGSCGPASGVLAGWAPNSGISSAWTVFGENVCPSAVKGLGGPTF